MADDVVYLKADEPVGQYFHERGLDQFQYEKQGKMFKMSYYMAPEDIFDDPEEARIWAVRSYEAAVRSRKPVKKGKKNK